MCQFSASQSSGVGATSGAPSSTADGPPAAPPYHASAGQNSGAGGGNWYPNPLNDPDAAAVWIARAHGQYHHLPPKRTTAQQQQQQYYGQQQGRILHV